MGNDTGFPKHNWAHTPGVPESNTLCLHCGTGPDSDIHLRTTEGSAKPPAGYVECPKTCGRWTMREAGEQTQCWQCLGESPDSYWAKKDWTPPIAPPAYVERRKGQLKVGQRRRSHNVTYTIYAIEGTRAIVCFAGQVIPGADFVHQGDQCCWETVSILEDCELITDAPADPSGAGEAKAECEPWCGEGLPPDDVCGYGFIDGPGDEREYFKLPGKAQRRKGYVYSWCSNECREKAATPKKAPPAQEAPAFPAKHCKGGCGLSLELAPRFVSWECANCIAKMNAQEAPQPKCEVCGARGFFNKGLEHPLCPAHALAKVDADAKRTAQEAQKAAPVVAKGPRKCMWRAATTPCAGPLAERHVGIAGSRESHGWCEGHYLEYERQAYERPAAGAPYKGPERLPRPALARDEMVEGDCWSEAGR